MDEFHNIYVDDNQVILSKCLFKCEVSREAWKAVCTQNLCLNFFRINILLVFPETQHYLLDSLNLIISCLFYNRYKDVLITLCLFSTKTITPTELFCNTWLRSHIFMSSSCTCQYAYKQDAHLLLGMITGLCLPTLQFPVYLQ